MPPAKLALALLTLAALFLLAACQTEDAAPAAQASEAAAIPFRADGSLAFMRDGEPLTRIQIEIAEDDSARARGLMERTSLPEGSGMLFIFPTESPQGFWMGNTPMALDLIFANADSQVVSLAKYAKPFSSETIPSRVPAQFVVEVPAGFADTHGIVEGDAITWERD